MRHKKKFNHLSRTTPHRKSMLANMASSLILHKRITTTTAKAKALRSFVEPVITRSREDTTHSRRVVFKHLRDKLAVAELFREVAGKVGERPGGYTRIIKLGNRPGDNADMCIIELVDFNENLLAEKAGTRTKSTRRRRGGKKKAEKPAEVLAEGSPDAAEEITEQQEAETEVTETEEVEETATGSEIKEEPEKENVKEDAGAEEGEEEAGVEGEAVAGTHQAGVAGEAEEEEETAGSKKEEERDSAEEEDENLEKK